METLLVWLLGALGLFLVVSLFIFPRLPVIWVDGYRWSVKDGILSLTKGKKGDLESFHAPARQIHIGSSKGRYSSEHYQGPTSLVTTSVTVAHGTVSSHSTVANSQGFHYTREGAHFVAFRLTEIRQYETTQRVLNRSADQVGLVEANLFYKAPYHRPNHVTVACSPLIAGMVRRWLRHHGVLKTPDTAAQEKALEAATTKWLAHYRSKFGFRDGDMDHLGLSGDLQPISYSLLTRNMDVSAHSTLTNSTVQKSLAYVGVAGRKFKDDTPNTAFFFWDHHPNSSTAQMSQAMHEEVRRAFKAAGGRPIEYAQVFE